MRGEYRINTGFAIGKIHYFVPLKPKRFMKRWVPLVFLFALFSCSVKNYPLKGEYPATPMVFNSENSFDKTWDKLVDVFAQKGLSIKIIDKSSGLIISTNSKMPATPENIQTLKPINSNAYIVVPSYKMNGRMYPISGMNVLYPGTKNEKRIYNDVLGEWNVRIKPNGSGSTINVNITNVTYYTYNYATKSTSLSLLNDYRSTGVFEKILADLVK